MSPARRATAVAHPNIALVKYWGKRDEALLLPYQSSLSVTLAPLQITTTVDLDVSVDEVEINGARAQGKELERVLRAVAEVHRGPARVVSQGDFPASAGLASSAAAFAALAVAVRAAAGLPDDCREASLLARRGSGSACRSVQGGFCVWRRGERPDGSDSYAEQRFAPGHWPQLRLVAAILSREEKQTSSRDGMRATVETSPYYRAWVEDAEAEVARAEAHLARRDLEGLGALVERNAWRMHATALAAMPPICYLQPSTLALISSVAQARRRGVPVWFTLDAGPNPVLLTDAAHEASVAALARDVGALEVVRCHPGGDAHLVSSPLA